MRRAETRARLRWPQGVVADQVSCGDNLLDERRLGLGVAADQKKGGADVAAGQKFEQARRPVGIGAVVEGKRQLAGGGGVMSVEPKSCEPGHRAA